MGDKAKKGCAKLREDGLAIEAGENDTLIVNKLAADPEMFGLFGYSYLVANKDKIKAAKIEGKLPSLASIQDYSYPIARPLFFYVKKSHVGVVPGIKEFLAEFTAKGTMGPKGYLTDIGLVPLDDKTYKTVRTAGTQLKTISLN
jgi:phosphate transport system substrate-binding protein